MKKRKTQLKAAMEQASIEKADKEFSQEKKLKKYQTIVENHNAMNKERENRAYRDYKKHLKEVQLRQFIQNNPISKHSRSHSMMSFDPNEEVDDALNQYQDK